METLTAIRLIDNFLGSEVQTTEIQRLADGWHIIQHVPSGATEQRTVRIAGREQTFAVPVYQRDTLISTESLAEAARFIVQQKTGKTPEEYQGERDDYRMRNAFVPTTRAVISATIDLDDYIVPWDYTYDQTTAAYDEACSNCEGEGIFRDRECIFCQSDASENCTRCSGAGRSDLVCPICNGAGSVSGILIARFVNAETGERLAIRIGGPSLPDISAYLHTGYTGNAQNRAYLHVSIELDALFAQICERLGVSEETHFAEWLGRISVRNWKGPLDPIQLDRLEMSPGQEPTIPDGAADDWNAAAREAFARRANHYRNDSYVQEKAQKLGVDPATWTFVHKRPFDEALDELCRRAHARGYGISIITRFYETGIHPLAIDLTDADGLEHLVQLGHDYSLEASVHQALRSIDAAMDAADRDSA